MKLKYILFIGSYRNHYSPKPFLTFKPKFYGETRNSYCKS